MGPSCIGCAASDLRWGVRCRIFTRQIYPGEHHRPLLPVGKVTFHQWILEVGGSVDPASDFPSMDCAPQGFTGQLDLMLILSSDTCNLSPNLITCRCNVIPLVKTETQLSNDLDGSFTTFFTNFNQMDAFVQRPYKPESWTGVSAGLTWTRVTIVGTLQQQPVLVKRNL